MLAYENSVPAAYRSAFVSKVQSIAANLEIEANWLMIVIRFESANTFLPYVKNDASGAVGLIQFLPSTAISLGTTVLALSKMSAVEQLTYVEKYLLPYKGKMSNLYDVYLAVFAPAYLGRSDAQKVYSSPSSAYTANSALDTNKDGVITIGEIKKVIAQYIPSGYTDGTTISAIANNSNLIPIAIIGGLILLLSTLKRKKRNG